MSNNQDLKFTLNTKYIYINESTELKYTCNKDCKVECSVDNENVAYIKGNVIHGVSVGSVEISITVYVEKEKYEFKEKINVVEKESYYFTQEENIIAEIGDEINLSPTITSSANTSKFTYESSNKNIVSIDKNGIAKINQFGEVSVYVYNHGRLVKTFNIKSVLTYSVNPISDCEYSNGKIFVKSNKMAVFEIVLTSGNKSINNFQLSIKNENLNLDVNLNKILITTTENLLLSIECLPLNYFIDIEIQIYND